MADEILKQMGEAEADFSLDRKTIIDRVSRFSAHFSPYARQERGRHRRFTAEDYQVLNTILRSEEKGMSVDAIAARLAAGDLNEPFPSKLALSRGSAALMAMADTKVLVEQNQMLQAEVEELRAENRELRDKAERQARELGAAEGENRALREQAEWLRKMLEDRRQ